MPALEQRIDDLVDPIYSDMTREELYQTPRDYVAAIRSAFSERPDILVRCDQAEEHINDRAFDGEDGNKPLAESSALAAPARPASAQFVSLRDPFEDIAAGHGDVPSSMRMIVPMRLPVLEFGDSSAPLARIADSANVKVYCEGTLRVNLVRSRSPLRQRSN